MLSKLLKVIKVNYEEAIAWLDRMHQIAMLKRRNKMLDELNSTSLPYILGNDVHEDKSLYLSAVLKDEK